MPDGLSVYLTDWHSVFLLALFTDWLTSWLIDWLTDGLTDWLIHWLTDWFTDSLTDWRAGWFTDWFTDWLSFCVSVCLTDELAKCLTDWLTDKLSDWLIAASMLMKEDVILISWTLSLCMKYKLRLKIKRCSIVGRMYVLCVQCIFRIKNCLLVYELIHSILALSYLFDRCNRTVSETFRIAFNRFF